MDVDDGRNVVAVAYGDQMIRTSLERALGTGGGRTVVTSSSQRPALGVDRVRVGWRRRPMWLIRRGATVCHRSESLDDAVRSVRAIISEWFLAPENDEVILTGQLCVRGAQAVIVRSDRPYDLDERRLAKAGVALEPTFRLRVVPNQDLVRVGGRTYGVVGVVLEPTPGPSSLRTRRERLWRDGARATVHWAWFVDRLGERLVDGPSTDVVISLFSGSPATS